MRWAGLVTIALVVSLGALSATTQTLASIFQYQRGLGRPIARIDNVAVYWPWSALAWSARWRDESPRPFAIAGFVFFAITGAGFVAIALYAGAAAPRLKRRAGEGWAAFDEALDAGLMARGGAVLGKFGCEILAYDGPGHLLLIGASRSGKGRGHVVPTLLTWAGSALVLDVKGELADGDARHEFPGVAGFRETIGPVLRFAPTQASSVRFNPLLEVRRGASEVRDVQNIVEIIVDPAGDGRHNDFWDRSARQILVGLILHVLYTEPDHRKTLAVVREKLCDLDSFARRMRLELHRIGPDSGAPEVHPEVLHAAESYLSGEERVRSGIKATAESFFGLFADPLVAANTASSDFRVGDLMCADEPVTLFLQPPPSDAQRLTPLMRLMLNQITRALMERQTEDAVGRAKRHELMLVLDEFPQLGRLPFFETAMGAFAGYGLKAYLVCQSLNHITRAYGRDSVIIDNCHVITAFAATDAETAKTISAMAGETWVVIESESVNRPRSLINPRRGATTYREERRPLILPGEARQLPEREEIIFVSGAKPLRAQKLRFDEEAVFAERLRPSSGVSRTLSVAHDWIGVRSLGVLTETRPAPRPRPAMARPLAAQGDLFARADVDAGRISDKALAGFRDSDGRRLPHPADQTPDVDRKSKGI